MAMVVLSFLLRPTAVELSSHVLRGVKSVLVEFSKGVGENILNSFSLLLQLSLESSSLGENAGEGSLELFNLGGIFLSEDIGS